VWADELEDYVYRNRITLKSVAESLEVSPKYLGAAMRGDHAYPLTALGNKVKAYLNES
jgi:YesN/AraC family two-component response regulator